MMAKVNERYYLLIITTTAIFISPLLMRKPRESRVPHGGQRESNRINSAVRSGRHGNLLSFLAQL